MSSKLPPRPVNVLPTPTSRIAIVASEYNPEFVQALVNHTCKELYQIEEKCTVELFGAPGAFEIPLITDMVLAQKRYDGVIALGVIMQGRTKHAEFIGATVTQSLQQISLKRHIPVIHEVLLVADEKEARERCIDEQLNRGIEAARALFSMLRARKQIEQKLIRR